MIRVCTENIKNIRNSNDFRLSPNYYNLGVWFNKLKESGWDISRLDTLTNYIDSGSYIAGYLSSPGINYIRVGDIKKYVIDESELKYVDSSCKKKSKLNTFDIYFGRTQATYSKLGVFAIATERIAGSAVSQHVAKISIKSEIIDPFYVVAYLNSKFGKAQMVLASYGDTRVEFTNNQISQIQILKLPDNDYNRVVQLSKRVVELNELEIESLNQAHKLVDNEFEASLLKCTQNNNVSKSILIENDLWTPITYKPEYVLVRKCILDFYPNETTAKIFSKRGKGTEVGSKNYRIEIETDSDSLPFIRTSDIYNNEVDMYPDYFFNPSDDPKIKVPKIEEDDIIFSKDGKIAQCSIVGKEQKYIPCSGYFILKKSIELDSNYLFAILSSKKIVSYQALMKTVIASTIPHLKPEKFDTIYIPIFSKELQDRIISEIKRYRESIYLKNDAIKEIQCIFDKYYKSIA